MTKISLPIKPISMVINYKLWLIFACLCSLLLKNTAKAQAIHSDTLHINHDSKEPFVLLNHSKTLRVKKGTNVAELVNRANEFHHFSSKDIRLDAAGDFDNWYLFEVNSKIAPLYLTLPITQSFEIVLYQWDSANTRLISKGGILPAATEKYLNHSTDIFDLNITANNHTRYLLKINRVPYKTFSARIYTPKALIIENQRSAILEGVLLGIIACVVLYHLLIYIRVPEAEYVLLSVYLFFLIIQIITITGLFHSVWQFKNTRFNHIFFNAIPSFSAFFSFWFSYVFLNINRKQHPLISKLFFAFEGLFVMSILFALFQVKAFEQLTIMISGLASLFLLAIGVIRLRQKFKPAIVYIIAYIPTFFSIPYLLLYFSGHIHYSWFTHNNLLVSVAAQSILFSLAIATKIRLLKSENETLLQKENLRLEEMVASRTAELQSEKNKVEETLAELKNTQTQLIQSEKMASLGELTAGIAHEIQNPLNFVNNFSEVNIELLQELMEEIENQNTNEIKLLATDIKNNEEKVIFHGKRADAIVKGMLQHSRSRSGQKELTDINALCDEYLRLSYHGLRAKDISFNAKFETNFDKTIGKINIARQDMGRVILNIVNNAFHAVADRKQKAEPFYEPTVIVSTKRENDFVYIEIKDNGSGIPPAIIDKIFQPFFTTKPTGKGTGLGLSMSYDIIRKTHNGNLTVRSIPNQETIFSIALPLNPQPIT